MSYALVEAVLDLPIAPTQKLVLAALARKADDDGRNCFPSLRLLAKLTSYHKTTIIRAIDELVTAGYVRRSVRGRGTEYTLFIPTGSGARQVAESDRSRSAPKQVAQRNFIGSGERHHSVSHSISDSKSGAPARPPIPQGQRAGAESPETARRRREAAQIVQRLKAAAT